MPNSILSSRPQSQSSVMRAMMLARRQRAAMEARAGAVGGGAVLDNGDPLLAGLTVEGDFVRGDLSRGGRLYLPLGSDSPTAVRHVYGAILDRYAALGGAAGWLGGPLSDEMSFSEEGRISRFEHGAIHWWSDTGAIELRGLALRYTGLLCFGETDWDQGSDSDEPYVVMGLVGPQGGVARRSGVYADVDAGESRAEAIELYRGPATGVVLTVQLMEHDAGDPDRYTAAMKQATVAGFAAVAGALTFVPVVGPILSGVAGPLLTAAAPAVGEALSGALDTGDDEIGKTVIALSAKQMVLLAARTPYRAAMGVPLKLETELLSGGGASYKACFAMDAL